MSYLWVLTVKYAMDYGILELYGFFIRNRVGGREISWGFTDYGLSQLWVKTDSTVVAKFPHIQYGCISSRQIKYQISAYTMWLYMWPISGCQIPTYTLQLYKRLMGAQNFNKIITSYKNS